MYNHPRPLPHEMTKPNKEPINISGMCPLSTSHQKEREGNCVAVEEKDDGLRSSKSQEKAKEKQQFHQLGIPSSHIRKPVPLHVFSGDDGKGAVRESRWM